MRRTFLAAGLATLLYVAGALSGCNHAAYLLYVVAPEGPTETKEAECDALPGRVVAIVIHADQSVQYEYPTARVELSAALAEELKEHVDGVSVVDWRRVIKYQDSNLDWPSVDRTKLAKLFNADFLLYVSLEEFSLRESGSLNLYRGRITANVTLYPSEPLDGRACLWQADGIRVIQPQEGHGQLLESARDVRDLSYQTVKAFAEELARRFYKHKVPK